MSVNPFMARYLRRVQSPSVVAPRAVDETTDDSHDAAPAEQKPADTSPEPASPQESDQPLK